MQGAPSVICPVGRSRFSGLASAALWLAGALLALRACLLADAAGWRQGLIVAAVLLSGAIAARGWLQAAQGELLWDGGRWLWVGAGGGGEQAGAASVVLDLQQRMLVRWRGEQAPVRWFWLERSRAPQHWHALRCAMHDQGAARRTGARTPSTP